jgi:hypothetical protein
MLMVVVVPREERLKPTARVQHAGEQARVVGLVLQRLDCASLKALSSET